MDTDDELLSFPAAWKAPTPRLADAEIVCVRCGRTTTDPDKWDPEADTGRIFCDRCWPVRDLPVKESPTAQWRDKVGRQVIFRYTHGEEVDGVVTSVNDVYVFVRFGSATSGEACTPENLRLAVPLS